MFEKITKRISNFPISSSVRSVGVLVGGTAFAQALSVLILPLLTRLFSPADFAILAVYASTLGVLSSIACLRLEIAIPIPEDDVEAVSLLVLALTAVLLISGLTGIGVFLFPKEISSIIGQPAFEGYLWLLPIGVLLAGLYAALQFWATRKKRFGIIAKTKLGQASWSAITQIGLGWSGVAPIGLLLGHLIYSGAGVIGLGRQIWNECRHLLSALKPKQIVFALQRNTRFLTYSTPEALANTGGIQIPVLLIASWAAGPEAGFLLLATRVMAAPIGLLGTSISQVYLSRAPEEMRKGGLGDFTIKVICALIKAGVGPLLFAGAIAPLIFPIVFGAQWGKAGEFVTWMTPWFAMQFISSPVSMVLHILGHQRLALALQIFGLVLRIGFVVLAAKIAPDLIVEFYAVSGFLFYALYFFAIARVARVNMRGVKDIIFGSWLSVAAWAIVSFVAYITLVSLWPLVA